MIRLAALTTLTCLSRPGRSRPDSRLAARFAAFQSFRYGVAGQLEKAVQTALAARDIQERTQLTDEWNTRRPAGPRPRLYLPGRLPGGRARGSRGSGGARRRRLGQARAGARCARAGPASKPATWPRPPMLAGAADANARRLGFDPAFFRRRLSARAVRPRAGTLRPRYRGASHRASALDNRTAPAALRVPGAAGPRADLGRPRARPRRADHRRRPHASTLAPRASPALLARADEQEALLRLSLGDLRSPAELAGGLPAARRGLLLAKVALAAGDEPWRTAAPAGRGPGRR